MPKIIRPPFGTPRWDPAIWIQDGDKIIRVGPKDRAKWISNDGELQKGVDSNSLAGYESPEYLKKVQPGPQQVKHEPLLIIVPTPPVEQPISPKQGSIVPTMYAHKKETPSPRDVSTVTTCTLCNGPVKDGECVMCSGKLCLSCGEMNFAMATSCSNCARTF